MEKKETIVKGSEPFEDERGRVDNYKLTEPINLVGLFTSKKGVMRANHFHPEQEQKVLLISGRYISVFKDLTNSDSEIQHQLVTSGDLSIMPPNVAHAMIFLEDSTFLNLVNGNRDHDKFSQHTIKHELVKKEEIEEYLSKYQDA
jgi:dTDP-4-dehydrorhamnose 3,5-epimerase-like enzyme